MRQALTALIFTVSYCFTSSLFAQQLRTAERKNPEVTSKWESKIREFESRDREVAPPKNATVFVGSSSIRGWNLRKYFPEIKTINRGFGGSQFSDAIQFVDRIVTNYKPTNVVIYSGDNDLNAGKSPDRVWRDFVAFTSRIRDQLPQTKIIVIAIKPSLKRRALIDKIRSTNGKIRRHCETQEQMVFVDVFTPMLDANGEPRKEVFAKDGLHLNDLGYREWSTLVASKLRQSKK